MKTRWKNVDLRAGEDVKVHIATVRKVWKNY
jgi:hypothetical protein